MKKFLVLIVAVGLAGIFGSAMAEPTCHVSTTGKHVIVTVKDAGVVFTKGQKPPEGWVSYPGTGNSDDIAASCSDNEGKCATIKWYIRFADAGWGWPSNADLETDKRVIRSCHFESKDYAMVCEYDFQPNMKSVKTGKVRMHYAAAVNGQVVAAYQPQGGDCVTNNNSKGGFTHTEVDMKE